jgi:hypothetical protein
MAELGRRLDRNRWKAASPYLDRVIDLDDEQRAAWLELLHEQDPELARDLEQLLAQRRSVLDEHFLEEAALLTPEERSLATFPRGGVVIKWEFAARGSLPPVTIYWSDTGDIYTPPGMTVEEMRAIPGTGPQIESAGGGGRGRGGAAPAEAGAPRAGRGRGAGGGQQQGSGCNTVFVGSKGYLGTSGRGEGVGLLPGSRWAEYSLPPRMLTRSPGHQRDWVRACKDGDPACSNFAVAGPTPNGWSSARRPLASKASCCGIQRRWSSPTTRKPTST